MVAAFFIMLGPAAWFWWLRWHRREVALDKWLLVALLFASPFGMIALESGWLVSEFGSQPWIIRDLMLVSEGVTPQTGIVLVLLTFLVVYLGLTSGLLKLLMLPALAGAGTETIQGDRHVES